MRWTTQRGQYLAEPALVHLTSVSLVMLAYGSLLERRKLTLKPKFIAVHHIMVSRAWVQALSTWL
jgi:hypothetical protein